MSSEIKIDNEYKESFNLGYELAKELNLKSQMFKDFNSENSRMNAMQAGMAQYSIEISQEKGKNKGFGLTI